MCVASASPHFTRIAARASAGAFHTAAALTRASACGAGFAGSCAANKDDPAHTIANSTPIRVIASSRRKKRLSASPYAKFVQEVKKDLQLRSATPCRVTHTCHSATIRHSKSPKKNGGGLHHAPRNFRSRKYRREAGHQLRPGDKYLVRAGNINVPQLGLDAERSQLAFPLRGPLAVPAQKILVLQDGIQLLQKRREGNRRL